MWEPHSKYMLNYIPIYILVMVSNISYFEKDSKEMLTSALLKKKISIINNFINAESE